MMIRRPVDSGAGPSRVKDEPSTTHLRDSYRIATLPTQPQFVPGHGYRITEPSVRTVLTSGRPLPLLSDTVQLAILGSPGSGTT